MDLAATLLLPPRADVDAAAAWSPCAVAAWRPCMPGITPGTCMLAGAASTLDVMARPRGGGMSGCPGAVTDAWAVCEATLGAEAAALREEDPFSFLLMVFCQSYSSFMYSCISIAFWSGRNGARSMGRIDRCMPRAWGSLSLSVRTKAHGAMNPLKYAQKIRLNLLSHLSYLELRFHRACSPPRH